MIEIIKIQNLYFKSKIPKAKLIPKILDKATKQEEQKAVAKIPEKIADKVPMMVVDVDLITVCVVLRVVCVNLRVIK
ncbi:MAG: hypothetical protein KatS3mg094_019 [Candidatus Parcubacteria bacterium]|nr:MAG: hypothetical protein KatS3mg094_019 [Candidatus Parcubacteria bacterium]